MPRFSHSLGISVGIHVTVAAVVLLIINFHPATPLPAANASLANAIAVSIVPPPRPATPPPQPREPSPPQAQTPVPRPPPQTISTQAAQADVVTPPPQTVPTPPPPQPNQNQSTPPQASYAQIVSAILEANKRYPRQALLAGDEGTVVISFILNREGTVLAYSIQQSSGQPVLDEAVRRLIERVHFPPFPQGDASQRKSFEVPIVFTLSS